MGKRTRRQGELGTRGKSYASSHPLSPCPLLPLPPLLPTLSQRPT